VIGEVMKIYDIITLQGETNEQNILNHFQVSDIQDIDNESLYDYLMQWYDDDYNCCSVRIVDSYDFQDEIAWLRHDVIKQEKTCVNGELHTFYLIRDNLLSFFALTLTVEEL